MAAIPAAQILGSRLCQRFVAAQQPAVRELVAGALPAGAKSEFIFSRPKEPGLPVMLSLRPISMEPEAIAVVTTDLSERKAHEEKLRRLKERFEDGARRRTGEVRATEELELILDSTPALIFYKDRENRFLRVNRAFAESMGASKEQLEGKSVLDLYPREQAEAYWRDDQEVLASGQPKLNIVEPMQTSGAERWLQTSKVPCRDAQGNITGIIGFSLDITERRRAEVALQRSERLYRAIGESIDYGVWVCEPDGRNIYASPSFLKLVGFTQEQCSNFGWGEVLHPEDAERTIAAWKKCVRTGGTWDIEHRFRGVDGQWHPVLARGVPVRDEQGRLLCWAGINLDISRLKQAQAELHSAAEQRRLALEAADLGAWDYQFQTGEVFWDKRCREMWGVPRAETFSYIQAISAIHAEDRAGVDRAVQQALAGKNDGAYHREFRVVWPDGSVRWIASHGRVYFQGDGAERHAVRFTGVNLDITAERQAREALRESQERLAAFAAATFEGIVLSERGRIMDCNEQFAQMAGRTVQELKGNSIEQLFAPEDRQRVMKSIRAGRETVIECQMLRRDGSRITVEAHGGPPRPSRRGLRHTAVRDITERKRAERRSELLAETASQLLATDCPQRVVEALCRKVLAFLDCQIFFNYLVEGENGGRPSSRSSTLKTSDDSGIATPNDRRTLRLHLNACAGIPEADARRIEWLDYGSAICGCVARDNCRIVAEDIQHTPDPRTELVKSFGIQAYACHPLVAERRMLGTLSFGTRTRTRFSAEELSLMTAVTDLVAIAMERQRIQAELQRINEELEHRVACRTAELHAASRYARSLIEASLDPVVTISPAGKITDVNEATELATGVARDHLIGTDFSHYFTEPATAEIGYQRVLAEGLIRNYPLTIRHLSGRTNHVLYNATVYRNEAGEVQGVFAAARDITERKEAERRRDFTSAVLALFAQKTTARDYLDSVLEVIQQWSGCQALGIRIADEQGEIPYESWAGFAPEFIALENRLSLGRDNCCCIRAITQAFEEPDRALLTPGGSYRCDNAIAYFNNLPPERQARFRGNCMKFGFASLAVIPIHYLEKAIGAIHLADRRPGQFPLAVVEFLEAMTPLIGEAVHRFQTEAELARHRNQLEVLVRQRTQELTDANARLQRTAEDLQRSNRDLEEFAYVASHDLQEPLRAVGGYVKLLEHRFPETLDAKAREYIRGAADGAVRMEQQITDLLMLSRVGTRGLMLARTNLDAPLQAALHDLQFTIRAARATVTQDPLPVLPVDARQMVQLFQNLISNALKFRGEDSPQIHVGARAESGRWVIWVRDNGIGIAPQYFERIFQVFQRLHTRRSYSGTGIGLAICRRIVERHDGRIWVESQLGQGSTFYFSLPADRGIEETTA